MKRLLAAAIALMLVTLASAQVKFGVTAGYDRSFYTFMQNKYTTLEVNPGSYNGYYAGLVVDVPITKHFDIQPEVLYAKTGSEIYFTKDYPIDLVKMMTMMIPFEKDTSEVHMHFTMHNVNVPILFKYHPRKNFSFEFGPYLNMTVGSTLSSTVDLGKIIDSTAIRNNIVPFTIGFTTGAEYRFDFGLFVEARISQAVMSACKKNDMDVKVRGNFITLGLGYMF